MDEVWKDIVGYEGLYLVSNLGDVFSIKSNCKMSGWLLKNGYRVVKLTKDYKEVNFSIHRLVAIHFVDNPYNKKQVNHIDEDKLNNAHSNLEWVTARENINHGTGVQRRSVKKKKKVVQMSEEGLIINIFDGGVDVENYGFCRKAISACCCGNRKSHGGYNWMFYNEC